jgi:colanic acid/amylovoran biosynthesis protein
MSFRFVLTGTYCHMNKGDAAMQWTTARELSKRYAQSEITIAAPYPEADREFYDPVPVVKCHRRNLFYSSIQCLAGWLWKKTGLRALILDEEMSAYARADLVVDLSGDMLTEDYGAHVALSHFFPILLANAMGRRVFLCAQSIGPFRYTKKLACYILNHAGAVTVRDQVSMDYLESIGVTPRRLGLTGDMAFLMEPEDVRSARQRLLGSLPQGLSGPILGVSLSFLIEQHFSKRCPVAKQVDFWNLMANALDRWIDAQHGCVVFFAHVTGPGKERDDREACRKVSSLMRGSHVLLEEDLRPDEIKACIRQCDLFLGARMHANIAALSSHIPTLAIGYSHKTQGIMTQLGCAEHVIPIDAMSASLLDSSLSRLYAEREDVRSRLHQRVPEVRELSLENLDRIDALLEPNSRA